jgi:DNA-binding CsgD family transcriptional regulator
MVCSDATGTWGALTLLREARSPLFTTAEVSFVASIADALADGLRRAEILREGGTDGGGETGILVLAPDNAVELANRPAGRWLDLLSAKEMPGSELPVAVLAVAARARRIGSGHANDTGGHATPGEGAWARVRVANGRWVVVRGSLVGEARTGRVAVLLEEARPSELAPLIADAYGFTARERRVTELAACGFATNDIAARLHISAYTVQDHLKSIFEKTGTGSRGDLVARLFFDHYAPRLSSAP